MKLYFIRHGQSYVNLEDWVDGNQDKGLTELGKKQAKAMAKWMKRELPAFDTLYASNMTRARETAQTLASAYDYDINWDDRLREIGNNRLDHTPWPLHNLPEYGEVWGSEAPFTSITPYVEQGESWMHFRVRVGAFIEEMVGQHRGETIVAVCHGGVISAAFDHIFNVGPWRRCDVHHNNTAIAYFEYVEIPRRETWRLWYQNRHDHLQEVAE